MDKRIEKKEKKIIIFISIFMIFLVLSISINTSLALAQNEDNERRRNAGNGDNEFAFDQNDYYDTGNGDLTAGEKCSSKGERVSGIASYLDNEIIGLLEKVSSILFMITTTMSAITETLDAIHALRCCPGDVVEWLLGTCEASDLKVQFWEKGVFEAVRPLSCFVNCGWCGGIEGDGNADCYGSDILGKLDVFGDIPNVNKMVGIEYEETERVTKEGRIEKVTGQEATGIGQFHMSPYENIYTAIGCACPVAILFNLRKLKTMYDVYGCCLEQACINGVSTECCDMQLSEATCMYWKGSILKTLVKALLSVLYSAIWDGIEGWLGNLFGEEGGGVLSLGCVIAAFNLIKIPQNIQSVLSAWDWMSKSFKEPSCSDLGFEDIEKGQVSGLWSETQAVSSLAMQDRNNDLRYDAVMLNYEKTSVAKKDLPSDLQNKEEFKNGATKYTTRDENGNPTDYYVVGSDIISQLGLKTGNVYDKDGKEVDKENFNKALKESKPAIGKTTEEIAELKAGAKRVTTKDGKEVIETINEVQPYPDMTFISIEGKEGLQVESSSFGTHEIKGATLADTGNLREILKAEGNNLIGASNFEYISGGNVLTYKDVNTNTVVSDIRDKTWTRTSNIGEGVMIKQVNLDTGMGTAQYEVNIDTSLGGIPLRIWNEIDAKGVKSLEGNSFILNDGSKVEISEDRGTAKFLGADGEKTREIVSNEQGITDTTYDSEGKTKTTTEIYGTGDNQVKIEEGNLRGPIAERRISVGDDVVSSGLASEITLPFDSPQEKINTALAIQALTTERRGILGILPAYDISDMKYEKDANGRDVYYVGDKDKGNYELFRIDDTITTYEKRENEKVIEQRIAGGTSNEVIEKKYGRDSDGNVIESETKITNTETKLTRVFYGEKEGVNYVVNVESGGISSIELGDKTFNFDEKAGLWVYNSPDGKIAIDENLNVKAQENEEWKAINELTDESASLRGRANKIQEDIGAVEGEIESAQKTIEKEKLIAAKGKEIISAKMKAEQMNMAYELTWDLFNSIFGGFAYAAIDNMCKEDWNEAEGPCGDSENEYCPILGIKK